MKGQSNYVPPPYIPLSESDLVADTAPHNENLQVSCAPTQWSSGICACFDDMQICCVGAVCPCFLFGKNAEHLGSGTMFGSCMTHFILCGLINSLCCFLTDGILLGLPGCFVASYACGYRKQLRSKYSLQEAPCGDFVTHLFCHLCAICQEYREIRDRSPNTIASDLNLPAITAPSVQTME